MGRRGGMDLDVTKCRSLYMHSQKVAAEKPSNDNATAKIDTLGYISDSPDIVLIYAYVYYMWVCYRRV